ncbi:MAG: glycosyltransferase family 4 protein [Candidatus Aminicenantia bacterium]
MKILFLYDFPLWGSGSGAYIRNLVAQLVKLNYKIGIICPEERRFLEEKIKQYRVSPPQTPVFVGHPELKGAKKYSELSEREITDIYKSYLGTTLEAVANFEPDLIHVQHLSLISWVARYINALKNIKYIITSHGSCLYDILSDKRYLPLCEDAVKAAQAITVVSGDTRTKFLRTFGRQFSKNLHIIPGGVDMSAFPSQFDTSLIDEKYGMKNKKVVLFTGRLVSQKGVRYLVRAAKDIKGELVLIGEGPEKQYLISLIEKKGLKNVRLLGYVSSEELPKFYYRADVFVTPSVWDEPLGLTILEAMAAKTPVVATRKGGIPLLVKPGFNGVFVRPRNSEKIAQAVNKLLENDKLRKKMGEAARETVEKKFTWKRTAKKFNSLYKKICGSNKR